MTEEEEDSYCQWEGWEECSVCGDWFPLEDTHCYLQETGNYIPSPYGEERWVCGPCGWVFYKFPMRVA